ncbi:MAG: DUF3892 domain-containing protein [Pseudonocardiales bacterium]|nr:MAG: DUF3892 domain-containing protein [Pseudonocardiales bacterium]
MARRFTHVRLSGGTRLEHITHLKAVDDLDRKEYTGTRAEWVSWIENGNTGYTRDRFGNTAKVEVVTPASGPKYLRTVADGTTTDNLLALPRF